MVREKTTIRVVGLVFLCGLLAGAPSCGGGGAPVSPTSSHEQPTVKVTTAHFRILADRAGADLLTVIAERLEANYFRITSDLRVADMPSTSVWVWQDSGSFYADMGSRGQVYYGATGCVRDAHAVSLLAASRADTAVSRTAVHEFAHVVSMAVNLRIPNNPRWLWETVALYESGEFVDPTTLAYMREGRYPSIADLDAAYNVSGQVYQVGYVLGDFIVQRWGLDGLVRLIQANGDLPAALGVTTQDLESMWRAFLHDKYGLPG